MFETESGMVARLVALHSIQSVVPVKKHELTASYMNDNSTGIFTDRYKIRDGGKYEDWIEGFQHIYNTSMSLGAESTGGYSYLDPRLPKKGAIREKWKIIINALTDPKRWVQ